MNKHKNILLTAAFALTLAIVPAACGSDDDSSSTTIGTVSTPTGNTDGAAGTTGNTDVEAGEGSGNVPTVETAGPLVIGMSETDAQAAVEAAGWTMRVTQRDGEDLAVTADFVENRVNVAVEAGVVTAVTNIG